MSVSVCLTINERDEPTMQAVFDSLKEQGHEQMVVAMDRSPKRTVDFVRDYWAGDGRVGLVELAGSEGWRSPVKAWNAAFARVSGDIVYCISSETVQAGGNVQRTAEILGNEAAAGRNVVLFGKAECSCGPGGTEVDWGGLAPGNLLCDSAHPRPLGFIWAGAASVVRQTGYDEGFASGYWHDDSDFFYRVWQTGADFIFDDSVTGLHLHHERPVLDTPAGQSGIAHNRAYIIGKYGSERPLATVVKRVIRQPGRTLWQHVRS